MWRKRKGSSISAHYKDESRPKRWKDTFVVSSSEDEYEDEDDISDNNEDEDEDEWDIKCILDESDSQYLIDWEDPWSPTWELGTERERQQHCSQGLEEQEKQGEIGTSNQPIEVLESDSPSPALRTPSKSPEVENSEPVECEIGQDSPDLQRKRSSSPLFVPFDAASSDEEDIPLVRSPNTKNAAAGALQHGASNPRVVPSSTQQARTAPLFEYVQKGSIPREYLLPEEFANTPQNNSQATDISEDTQQSDSLFVPGTDQGPQRPKDVKIRENSNNKRSLFPERTATQSGKEVEIAETPPGLLPVPESQTPLFRPQETNIGSQFPSQLISIRSSFSGLVSQIYSSGGTRSAETLSFYTRITAAHHTNTVPDSSAPSHSQNSSGTLSQSVKRQSLPVRNIYPRHLRTNMTMDDRNQNTEAQPASVMDKYSHIEGSTPREKMRNAHAQLRAKSTSLFSPNPEPSATPSSAGDIEASAPISSIPVTAPLSVRSEKEPAPHPAQARTSPSASQPFEPPTQMEHPQQPAVQTIQPSALTFTHAQEVPPGSVHLGPSEFAISLPMDSRVKDDYDRILGDGAQIIKEFVRVSELSSNVAEIERGLLVPRLEKILEQLSNVSTHPDLNIVEHINDSESDLNKEAAWAEYSSAKFLLLGYLVQLASNLDLHLIVMVQAGKTHGILERYLLGKGLTYTRSRQEMGAGTNLEVSMAKGSLSFGIQSTQSEGLIRTYRRPSAIIALDRSFNAKNPSVEHMRTTYARDGSLLPVMRLFVSNTSEHIECCFHDVPPLQHLRLVIQYTVCLRDMVGDLQDNALGVHEDAEEILSCLQTDNFHANWPLPVIEPLQMFSPEEIEAAVSQNQSDSSAGSTTIPSTQKRSYAEDTGEQASKRFRVDPSQDLTAESTQFPSQPLGNSLQALEGNLMQMRQAQAAELDKLRKALADTQSRLQEREKAMETLQHRYEFRTKELHQTRQERDRLTQTKASTEQRVERQKEEISKLKDERTELRHELEKARESLKAGGGSMAELENAREEIRRLTKEQTGLERKADYERNQGEYTREQYQNASKVAAQSGNENRQLRDENENLKRRVAGEASRLREINIKHDESRHLSRVEELEALLTSREDLLRRKEDELREIRKNRPSTRATSTQPRSPKWAATSRPGSPGINNNNNSNNGLGRGSALRFSSEMSL